MRRWPAGTLLTSCLAKTSETEAGRKPRQTCLRALRMPVASILAYLSGGMSIDEMLKEWPELERGDMYQALGFVVVLTGEKAVPPKRN
ncbi:MAG: DUF433 domain-containing protein [Candidatus Binataceae bacterium]